MKIKTEKGAQAIKELNELAFLEDKEAALEDFFMYPADYHNSEHLGDKLCVELGFVEQGGCWNDGGEIFEVIRIGQSFFRRNGCYSSWDSNYWEEWEEVQPVEKTIIEYE